MADQQALCRRVLEHLDDAGILQDMVLIGSWCLVGYQHYFSRKVPLTTLRTRDIDFMVPKPSRMRHSVDVPVLLEELGFVRDFHRGGYMRLVHPALIVEFLVPERGRGTDKPIKLPKLKTNAQALRFLNLLDEHTVTTTIEGVHVRVPHPAAFALQKLLIAPRRVGKTGKREKDLEAAFAVLMTLHEHGGEQTVRYLFSGLSKPWKSRILVMLKQRPDISELLHIEN